MTKPTIIDIDFEIAELLKKQSELVNKATDLLFSMPHSQEREALMDAYHAESDKLGIEIQRLFELRSARLNAIAIANYEVVKDVRFEIIIYINFPDEVVGFCLYDIEHFNFALTIKDKTKLREFLEIFGEPAVLSNS